MRRLVSVIFVIVASALAFFLFSKKLFVKENLSENARVVIPNGGGDSSAEYGVPSLIELYGDETLISTIEADIDDDGFDDQISVLRTLQNPNLLIVVGLYRADSKNYVRSFTIQTEISQVRTFACTCLDVVGDHTASIVYQGTDENGEFVLKIYRTDFASQKFSMNLVGDFKSTGTVFVQQSERDESYQIENARGKSFPVWIYESEAGENGRTDQIQTMFEWNASKSSYVEMKKLRVPGSTLAAKELARVQDGTVASFAKFLNGLWYKNDGSENKRYIFFDYQNSEIVFQHDYIEEVYSWFGSTVSRGGIYFSSVNKSIENLQRRFDISLVSLDEIRIRIQDDVRMLIGEENIWDGSYRKVISKPKKSNRESVSKFVEKLVAEETWETEAGVKIGFTGNSYTASGSGINDRGRYTQIDIFGRTFLQFRSEGEVAFFTGDYQPVEKDGSVVLRKVSVNPEGFYAEQVQPVVLRRFSESEGKAEAETVSEPEIKEEDDFQTQNAVTQIVKADEKKELPVPKASIRISPRYFSPDGDGSGDTLNVLLDVQSEAEIKFWSFVIKNPDGRRVFWKKEGKGKVDDKIVWNGKATNGEFVQSATDYPYTFTLTDSNGTKFTEEGFIQVDILVISEGGKLKIQVPSIIFRSDNADFKSHKDVISAPNWDGESKGLDAKTIENNVRVLSRVAQVLKKFPNYNVLIEGNANNMTGTQEEEKEIQILSEQRAKFVLNWLVREGIDAKRLSATGNGGKYMLVSPHDASQRWKNRRVEFILIK